MQDLEEMQRLQESGVQMKLLLVLPLYHVYGMVAINMLTLAAGSQLVLLHNFEPNQFLATIEKYKVLVSSCFSLFYVKTCTCICVLCKCTGCYNQTNE